VDPEESIESMKSVDTATDQDIKEEYALKQQADKINKLFTIYQSSTYYIQILHLLGKDIRKDKLRGLFLSVPLISWWLYE